MEALSTERETLDKGEWHTGVKSDYICGHHRLSLAVCVVQLYGKSEFSEVVLYNSEYTESVESH